MLRMKFRQNLHLLVHVHEDVVPAVIQPGHQQPQKVKTAMGQYEVRVLHLSFLLSDREASTIRPTGQMR